MHFLYPYFLWALTAISIPVIIHLFQFRKFKKIYFTNVRLLKEIKDETTNRNKLKHLLILLSRILAVSALVFAFAQPFIPQGDSVKSGLNHVSVFVDNSFSMSAGRNDIPLLDYAKDKARAVINAYTDRDKFQIITNDFEGKHQRFVSREDALNFIDDIELTPNVHTIDQVINRQSQLFSTVAENKICYIISDFQKSILPAEAIEDTTIEINFLPVQTSQLSNVSIDSVWFDGPVPFINQMNKLIIRTKNNSNRPVEQVKISFSKDGQEKPVSVRDLDAGASVTDTVSVSVSQSGWHQGVVKVTDYPILFDNDYYIAFHVPDTIKTLMISASAPSRYMDALFKGIKNLSLSNQNINQLQYQQFPDYDLIIINDLVQITSGLASEIKQYMQNGGKVLLFPGKSADLNSYNGFFGTIGTGRLDKINKNVRDVSGVNTDEFIFSDVFLKSSHNLKLPKVQLSYDVINSMNSGVERILTFRDGGTFLSKNKVGDGLLYMCTAPLDNEVNDLVLNAEIFVPMVYKIAISGTKQKTISHTITNHIVFETDNMRKTGDFTYKVKNENSEFIPGQMPKGNKMVLDLNAQIKKSGFYDLLLDDRQVGKLAFNYNRKESDLTIYEEKELVSLEASNPKIKVIGEVLQADITNAISEKDNGIVLWKWFVILALIFLATETLLIRLLK